MNNLSWSSFSINLGSKAVARPSPSSPRMLESDPAAKRALPVSAVPSAKLPCSCSITSWAAARRAPLCKSKALVTLLYCHDIPAVYMADCQPVNSTPPTPVECNMVLVREKTYEVRRTPGAQQQLLLPASAGPGSSMNG